MDRKILDAALKEVYMIPTRQGVKKHELRTATEYWVNKLVDVESYGGKSALQIRAGLVDGTLELKPRDWTHILFHQSGSSETLLVEIKEIVFIKYHFGFIIKLGEIIE